MESMQSLAFTAGRSLDSGQPKIAQGGQACGHQAQIDLGQPSLYPHAGPSQAQMPTGQVSSGGDPCAGNMAGTLDRGDFPQPK